MDQKILDIIRNIDWGVVTGLITLFTALAGLHLQRTHDKLSVKPMGMITLNIPIPHFRYDRHRKFSPCGMPSREYSLDHLKW